MVPNREFSRKRAPERALIKNCPFKKCVLLVPRHAAPNSSSANPKDKVLETNSSERSTSGQDDGYGTESGSNHKVRPTRFCTLILPTGRRGKPGRNTRKNKSWRPSAISSLDLSVECVVHLSRMSRSRKLGKKRAAIVKMSILTVIELD